MKYRAFVTDPIGFSDIMNPDNITVRTMKFTNGDRVVVDPFDLEATVRKLLLDLSDEYNENHYVVEFDDFQSARYDDHRADWVHRAMVVREAHLSEPQRWVRIQGTNKEVAANHMRSLLSRLDIEFRAFEGDEVDDFFKYTFFVKPEDYPDHDENYYLRDLRG